MTGQRRNPRARNSGARGTAGSTCIYTQYTCWIINFSVRILLPVVHLFRCWQCTSLIWQWIARQCISGLQCLLFTITVCMETLPYICTLNYHFVAHYFYLCLSVRSYIFTNSVSFIIINWDAIYFVMSFEYWLIWYYCGKLLFNRHSKNVSTE
jgi:hypothetical protein